MACSCGVPGDCRPAAQLWHPVESLRCCCRGGGGGGGVGLWMSKATGVC
jgi:hypothetical protein